MTVIGAWIDAAAARGAGAAYLEEAGGAGTLTFGALQGVTRAMARRLDLAGIPPGGRVAVRLPDPLGYGSALVAIIAAGRVAVPLDPRAPAARHARVLAVARPAAAVPTGIQIIIILPPLHLASECQLRRKCCKLALLVIAKTAVEGRLRIRQTRERGSHAGEAFSALAHAFRWIGRKLPLLPHPHPFASVVAQRPICRLESGPVLFLLGAQPQTLLE